ncbi:MAG: hypothetical protein SGPRY_005941 [Prymnesium sp.]
MDKQAWLNSIFNGSPPGDMSTKSDELPPPSLDSSGTSSHSLALSWRWAHSSSAPSFRSFELRWREANTPSAQWRIVPHVSSSPSFSSYKLRGLQPNTQYAIAVQGLPSSGGAAVPGAELVAATAPTVPPKPEITGGGANSISLRWGAVAGAGIRYAVYGSAALGFAKVYAGAETRCTVTGLDQGKEYGFRVCAMNSHGGASDFSVETITTCGVAHSRMGGEGEGSLIMPELLKLSHDSLSMRWEAPPGGASLYLVELAEAEDGEPPEEEWSTIYEGAPPGLAYIDHAARKSQFGPELIIHTPPEPSSASKREGDEVGCESESESVGPQPAGGVHLRLYGIHKKQLERLEKLREEREAALLNQMTTLTLEQRASQGVSSPRQQPSAFGSNSPRPHLWLAADASGGGGSSVSGVSPRSSTVGKSGGGGAVGEEAGGSSPGPGAYEGKASDFKSTREVQRDPALGASSAFRSKSGRFVGGGSSGSSPKGTPGVGAYSPRLYNSIELKAERAARRGQRLAGLRVRSIAPPARLSDPTHPTVRSHLLTFHISRTHLSDLTGLATWQRVESAPRVGRTAGPGPGSYEPLARIENERKQAARRRAAVFLSGTRRSLPWGGSGNNAPRLPPSPKSSHPYPPALPTYLLTLTHLLAHPHLLAAERIPQKWLHFFRSVRSRVTLGEGEGTPGPSQYTADKPERQKRGSIFGRRV